MTLPESSWEQAGWVLRSSNPSKAERVLHRSLAEGAAKGQQRFGSPSTSSKHSCFGPDLYNFHQVQIHQSKFCLSIVKRLIHRHCSTSLHGDESLSYRELYSTSHRVITFQGQTSSFPPMQRRCQQEGPGFTCVCLRDCGMRLTHVGFTRCLSVEWAASESKGVLRSMPNWGMSHTPAHTPFFQGHGALWRWGCSFLAWRISHHHKQNIRGMGKRWCIDFAL